MRARVRQCMSASVCLRVRGRRVCNRRLRRKSERARRWSSGRQRCAAPWPSSTQCYRLSSVVKSAKGNRAAMDVVVARSDTL
eukprot:1347923-Pleurochrysis_carterae.AAC.2